MVSGLLAHLIRGQTDMEVAGEVSGPVDLLLTARRTGADVIVLPLPDSAEMPGVCSHLLAEHPDLLILALSVHGRSGFLYRRTVTVDPVAAPPVENILAAIRTAEGGTGRPP